MNNELERWLKSRMKQIDDRFIELRKKLLKGMGS